MRRSKGRRLRERRFWVGISENAGHPFHAKAGGNARWRGCPHSLYWWSEKSTLPPSLFRLAIRTPSFLSFLRLVHQVDHFLDVPCDVRYRLVGREVRIREIENAGVTQVKTMFLEILRVPDLFITRNVACKAIRPSLNSIFIAL